MRIRFYLLLLVLFISGCILLQESSGTSQREHSDRGYRTPGVDAPLIEENISGETANLRRLRYKDDSTLHSETWYPKDGRVYDPICQRYFYWKEKSLAYEEIDLNKGQLPQSFLDLARPVDLSQPGIRYLIHTYLASGELSNLQYTRNDTVYWQAFYPDGSLKGTYAYHPETYAPYGPRQWYHPNGQLYLSDTLTADGESLGIAAFDSTGRPIPAVLQPVPDLDQPGSTTAGISVSPVNMEKIRQFIGYPHTARDKGIQGSVIYQIQVDPAGTTQAFRLKNPIHPSLALPVASFVSMLQFENEADTSCWIKVPFNFKLLR